MNRLRVLGLALVAIMLMSGVAASDPPELPDKFFYAVYRDGQLKLLVTNPGDLELKNDAWWEAAARYHAVVVSDPKGELATAFAAAETELRNNLPQEVTPESWGLEASLDSKKLTRELLKESVRAVVEKYRLASLLYAANPPQELQEKLMASMQKRFVSPDMTPAACLSYCPSGLITSRPSHPKHKEFVAALEDPAFNSCFEHVRDEFRVEHQKLATNSEKTELLHSMVGRCFSRSGPEFQAILLHPEGAIQEDQ